MAIEVNLLSHSEDPMRSLYMAYRTCYSQLTPQQVAARIEDERIPREKMHAFIVERLKTGHASPLEQVWFEFAIAGVSRAFSHQFVRHRVGISFEQQSQRYVTYKKGKFPYSVPKSVDKAGMAEKMEELFGEAGKLYEEMVAAGVPAEDARFLLPNATNTNFKITVNFQSLLHICDLRLCTRAQWEFRRVAALLRAEVARAVPGAGELPAAQVRRASHGLLRRVGGGLGGLPDRARASPQGCALPSLRPVPQGRVAAPARGGLGHDRGDRGRGGGRRLIAERGAAPLR